ncbi:MAG: lecithin retinol acyltransferase family protein [Xenococcaceae cyanobacterium]
MARGDQLYVYRELFTLDGLYKHHGIDCGDGTVIHYRKPSEIVERTSFATFSRGNPVYSLEYSKGFCFVPEVVVERAESRLGEDKYNFLFNNCEHFATWCKTGISDSKQIREFIPAIGKLKTSNLYEPIKQALQGKDRNNAKKMLNEALSDIKFVWNQVQPDYKKALQEMEAWDKVAREAVKRDRDDLAKAALGKKWDYRQKATKLEAELDELAEMTENLLRNQHDLG